MNLHLKPNFKWIISIVVITTIGLFVSRHLRREHDKRMTSSCANHVIQHKMAVLFFLSREERFPPETDTRTALSKMSEPGDLPPGWLSSRAAACPEAFKRDNSIGYVFVADSLPTKIAEEQRALVLFCPAASHQRFEEHCHALFGSGELDCPKSNTAMIDLLRKEIERGKKGEISYSAAALSKMQSELAAREKHERRRKGTY